MNEGQLQAAVIECAQLLGWRVAHFRVAKTEKGWRTPVSADGAGFPDLVMVRGGRLIFAELKGDGGAMRTAQVEWTRDLAAVSVAVQRGGLDEVPLVDVQVWKPADWKSGRIEEALRA
jgi:hypothetical protein